ncbi:hypothetical protein WG66_008349 [Moniliophthora roreri]|nr:hypothetical protein WG66_008349 [Moniliophthora roreri]
MVECLSSARHRREALFLSEAETRSTTFMGIKSTILARRYLGELLMSETVAAQAVGRTMSNEFEYVKCGHITGVEDLGSAKWHWELQSSVDRSDRKTVSTVNVHPD